MKLKKASSITMFIMLYSNIMLFCAFPNPMVLGSFLQECLSWVEQGPGDKHIDLTFEFEEGLETEEQSKDLKKTSSLEEEMLHEAGALSHYKTLMFPMFSAVLFEAIQAKSQLGFSRLLLPPPECRAIF